MAVVFYLLVNGHGRGSRPRMYKGQSVSAGSENQPNSVLLLGFYSVPRLAPIDLFAFSSRKRERIAIREVVGTNVELQTSYFY